MASFCKSRIRLWSVWRRLRIARRPNFSNMISRVCSSPTSASGSSSARASDSDICKLGFSTSPSGTTSRFWKICTSPLSGLRITSRFSSVPNIFASTFRNDSSSTLIIVVLSMFLSSLNSANCSTILGVSSFFAIAIAGIISYFVWYLLIRILCRNAHICTRPS